MVKQRQIDSLAPRARGYRKSDPIQPNQTIFFGYLVFLSRIQGSAFDVGRSMFGLFTAGQTQSKPVKPKTHGLTLTTPSLGYFYTPRKSYIANRKFPSSLFPAPSMLNSPPLWI